MPDVQLFHTGNIKHHHHHRSVDDQCEVLIHLHDGYEIFISHSEDLLYFVHDRVYEMKKGDIIITNDQEIHQPRLVQNPPYARQFFQFHPGMFSQLYESDYHPLSIFTHRKPGSGNLIRMSEFLSKESVPHCVNKVQECIHTIEHLSNRFDSKSQILADSYFLQLLIYLQEVYELQKNAGMKESFQDPLRPMDPRVKKMLNLMDEHFHEPISIDFLCKQLFIDQSYMAHLFKSDTGLTMMMYLQSKRIQHAKNLIHEGVPITEISQRCGFSDYTNFYKSFCKLVKCSPSDYRKKIT